MKKALIVLVAFVFVAGYAVSLNAADKKTGAAATADCSKAPVPDTPVAGMIGKAAWKPVVVELNKSGSMEVDGKKFDTYRLIFRSEDDIFAKRSAEVTFLVKKGQAPDGKTYRRLPNTDLGKQPLATDGLPEVQGWEFRDREADLDIRSPFNAGGSLRLEFGKASGKTISGKINMCVPANKDSGNAAATVSGTFKATMQ